MEEDEGVGWGSRRDRGRWGQARETRIAGIGGKHKEVGRHNRGHMQEGGMQYWCRDAYERHKTGQS